MSLPGARYAAPFHMSTPISIKIMKKIYLPLLTVLVTSLFFIAGCQKTPVPPDPPSNCCRVTEIRDSVYGNIITYEYDGFGHIQYLRTYEPYPVYPDYKFIYDNLGRLNQYIIGEGSFAVGEKFSKWHFLYYDNLGRIAYDTAYVEGGMIGSNGRPVYPEGMPHYVNQEYITYDYNVRNQLIAEHATRLYTNENRTRTWTYNNDGNLTGTWLGNNFIHDNKVSYNSLDPAIQFISRDYSVNNLKHATTYNEYGLPTEFPYNNETIIIWDSFLTHMLTGAKLTYKCDFKRMKHQVRG